VNPERFALVKELLLSALAHSPAERSSYLAAVCGDDAGLRAEVEGLLARQGRTTPGMWTGALSSLASRALSDLGSHEARPPLPDRVGPYRVLGILGEGGMGVVYRAAQEEPVRREVALKVLRAAADSPAVLSRFETERQTLARLDHPNIARLLDAASTGDGRPYFAMELVRGAPLTDYCREAQVDVRGRLRLFLEVCRAVRHAHRSGVIHRDLKPSNILVTLVHDQTVPKVIDFGIAKALGDEAGGTEARTRTGQIVGTLEYMSPEQAKGAVHALDTRSDVYALGVILYELLADRLPHDFADQPLHEVVRRIVEEPPRPLRKTATTATGKVDADLDTLVRKCLEKDPERRYGSAAELCEDLERYLSSRPILARPPSALYTLRKLMGRHRVAFGAAAAVVVALAAGLVGTSLGLVRASRARAAAEASAREAQEQAEIAQALNQFFVADLLSAPVPTAQGIDVTMREVLAVAAGTIEGKFAGRPRVEAQIRKSIGWVYWQLGEHASAEPQLVRALELFESTSGTDDLETQEALTRLAGLRHDQDRPAEAAALSEEVLRRRRRTLGDNHRLTVQTMSNLGSNYFAMGRYSEAEPLLVAAVEGRRRILGPHHPGTYRSMSSLANVYYETGRSEEAVSLYRETSAGVREHLGTDHAEFCQPTTNLAMVYFDQGRIPEARETIESALDPCRRVWGPIHPFVITAVDIASQVWSARLEWDRALTALGELLGAIESERGQDDPRVARVLWCLARVEAARGNKARAEADIHRAATLQTKSKESTASDILYVKSVERGILGDLPAALDLLEKAIDAGYAQADDLFYSPEFRPVRDLPRFKSLLARARANWMSPPPISPAASSRESPAVRAR
jgi:serine/threonine protein kinase